MWAAARAGASAGLAAPAHEALTIALPTQPSRRAPRPTLAPRPRARAAAAAAGAAGGAAAAPAAAAPPAPPASPHLATLLVQCADAKGVVAALSQLFYGMNCNLLTSDQFTALDEGQFYQRITLDYGDMLVGPGNTAVLEKGIDEVARRFGMAWQISYAGRRKRLAILVSKLDHCLYDLLIRREAGELDADIAVVASNWPDLAPVAAKFGVDFVHLPVEGKGAEAKAAQEARLEALLAERRVDVVVLARYMQIFSPEFAARNWRRTLNIHHSFLPAFEGARPYHRAHERGVKVIGATAHFATADLDCGPIVDQDVARVTHRDSVADMVRKGRDLERLVLARALRWCLQDRVIVTAGGGKTVVFED
jgi:formyltetrahydrofolate deformylase